MKNQFYRILASCLLTIAVAALVMWPGFRTAPKRLLRSTITRVNSALFFMPLSRAAGGVYDTTDRYLDALQIPSPSNEVLNVFATIPADDAMMFITSGNDAQTELVYRSINYLGWPRQIGEIKCHPDGSAESLFTSHSKQPIKWLFFHRIGPPVDFKPWSKAIGPHLTLASVSELKAWKSYCSQ